MRKERKAEMYKAITNDFREYMLGIYFGEYRTGGSFHLKEWFLAKELYKTDRKFKAMVKQLKQRSQ